MGAEGNNKTNLDNSAIRFWAGVGLRVREGMRMHQLTGQLEKGANSWRNVTEHCLVQTARSEVLGNLIGLPEDLVQDMRVAAMLHDFDKKQEITVTKEANRSGISPLLSVRAEHIRAELLLERHNFSDRVIRLAGASGVNVPQLVQAQRILDQNSLSDEDLAWLVIHYVDDCSIGADWVKRSQEGRNIIDFRMEQNKSKPDYVRISQEIRQQLLNHPKLGGMNIFDAAAFVDRQIEERLAQKIVGKTGENINPLKIPELVDQKIRESIENTKVSNNRT